MEKKIVSESEVSLERGQITLRSSGSPIRAMGVKFSQVACDFDISMLYTAEREEGESAYLEWRVTIQNNSGESSLMER